MRAGKSLFCGVLLLAGLASACGAPAPKADADSTEDDLSGTHRWCTPRGVRAHPLTLAVEPGAKSSPWTDAMTGAKDSVHVLIYQMGTGPILDGLIAAAKGGLDVEVILDASQKPVNDKFKTQLEAAGAKVEWSDPQFSFMHAKTMIVDGKTAVVSTGNYSAAQLDAERNYVMTDIDAHDVAALGALFDADFARAPAPDLTCSRIIVSPINSRDRILEVINSANTELLVESMQLADTDVRNALVARKAKGATVRVILADPSWIAANTDAAAFLAKNGIEARRMLSPKVHVKSIQVDGSFAYAGSENLSQTSLDHNREIGLVVTEADNIATMHATFESDWATATPF